GGRAGEDRLEEVLGHRARGTTSALALLAALLAAGCATSSMARGRHAMDDGDFEGAARWFRQAAQEEPRDESRWIAVGRAEMAAERWQRARDALTQATLVAPTDARARVLIGNCWELERRYDEALVAYAQAVDVAPADPYPHRVLGTRLLRWGEYEAAIPPLTRAA